MKLEPKAKPVRFCIESGRIEHYSLQSLREHFEVEAIYKLMDGRFVRWLNLIGESDIATKVIESNFIRESDDNTDKVSDMFSESGLLELLDLIYQKKWESLFDAYVEISKSGFWKSEKYPYLDSQLKMFDIHKLLEEYQTNRNLNIALPLRQELVKRLDGNILIKDSESLYKIGHALADSEESSKDFHQGVEYIKRAISLGNNVAAKWLLSHFKALDIHQLLKEYQTCKNLSVAVPLRQEIAKRLDEGIGDAADDEKFLYDVGRVLVESEEGSNEFKTGVNCIKRASILGNRLAALLLSKRFIRQTLHPLDGLKPYELDYATKDSISKCLRGKKRFNITNSTTLEEKVIYEFFVVCEELLKLLSRNYLGAEKLAASKMIIDFFSEAKPRDFLGEEKIFILAKITGQNFLYNKIIEYGPAYSSRNKTTCTIRNLKLNFWNMGLKDSIQAIIDNLFELSAYGREDH